LFAWSLNLHQLAVIDSTWYRRMLKRAINTDFIYVLPSLTGFSPNTPKCLNLLFASTSSWGRVAGQEIRLRVCPPPTKSPPHHKQARCWRLTGYSFVAYHKQWRSQPKNWGGKMFDFKQIALFCLEKRPLKHRITIFFKHLGGAMALLPPPGYVYDHNTCFKLQCQ